MRKIQSQVFLKGDLISKLNALIGLANEFKSDEYRRGYLAACKAMITMLGSNVEFIEKR